MKVLIVSRTKMGGGDRCIGGLTENNQSLRLLTETGGHQPQCSPYQIGQIWEMRWAIPPAITKPHVEDVHLTASEFVEKQPSLLNHLLHRVQPWRGNTGQLFDGLLRFTSGNNGYISHRVGLPNGSTGFWVPDLDLNLRKDGAHYGYDDGAIARGMKYVGEVVAPKVIPAGSLVRISLARWWKPQNSTMEERCYLQLSGWY